MIKFVWTLTEEMLGSASGNPDLHHEYIASKAPDAKKTDEEVAALGVEAVEEKGITIFPKLEDGTPFVWDYQIRGFLKESFSALSKAGKAGYYGGRHCAKLKAFKKAVDQHIFVTPRKIPFQIPEGAEMGYCVRPLRAETPMGARVALAKSETVPAGSKLEFNIICLIPELEECVNEAMEYGYLHGFGQWRNSGKGAFKFDYEIIDDEEESATVTK